MAHHALPADQPKFCTMIIDEKANHLKIEQEFVRRHGNDLPRSVFLQVHTSDKLWKVEVFKSINGEILFKNGWEKFKQHYDVKFGDFLVFKFDASSSKFDVFICDRTCTHIELYSDEETRSESDVGLEESSEIQKMKWKGKRSKTDSSLEKSTDDDTENSEDNDSLSSDKSGGSRNGLMPRAYVRQLTIYQSYILRLPKYFTRGLSARNQSHIILKDVKGTELKVKLVHRGGKFLLGAGWKEFLLNNEVTIGSTLSFVFSVPYKIIEVKVVKRVPDKKMLFEYVRKRGGKPVIISSDDLSRENPGDHTKNKDTYVTNQEGGSSSRTNYSFIRQIMLSNRHRFELPKEFITSTEINSYEEIIMKNVKGRGWWVQNTCRTSGRCTLGSGWHDFLIDNKVIVGSTLEFKFISDSEYTIEVRVIKPGANENEVFNGVRKIKARRQIVDSHDHADSVNDEHAKQQENGPRVGSEWAFTKSMKMHHAYKMDIPQDFVRETGIAVNNKIRLKVESGEEWLIEVTSDKRRYRYSMNTGWREFLKDNKVLEGSTISFRFIPNSDNVVEVQVLKNGTGGKPLFPISKELS